MCLFLTIFSIEVIFLYYIISTKCGDEEDDNKKLDDDNEIYLSTFEIV